MPTTTVILPPALRKRADHQARLQVEGTTIREIIEALERRFPGIRFNLCDETGELRPYVNIFIEKENIRYLQGLDTPIHTEGRIYILPSVAGG
jgi:molybdopterin synthase sulfur carrier subunit